MLVVVLGEPAMMGALRDLDEVLLKFNTGPTNCARVLDAIRKAIAPGEKDKKKAWRLLQEALNVEEELYELGERLFNRCAARRLLDTHLLAGP